MSEDSTVQGNRGGWKQSMHWNGVRPVVVYFREFCAYLTYGRKRLQLFWLEWQYVRRYLPISCVFRSVWLLVWGLVRRKGLV